MQKREERKEKHCYGLEKRGEMRWEREGDLITLETKAQNPRNVVAFSKMLKL